MTREWFASAPPCSAPVPCGQGTHTVRWEAGRIRLPSHPDDEAERVIAALGGGKPRCVEVFEAWERHADDLSVLTVGPRGPRDRNTVTWQTAADPPVMFHARRRGHGSTEREQQWSSDLLSLLALGPALGYLLSGHVVAAHSGRLHAGNRPALTAAVEGRFALAATEWIGIDPGQVRVTLLDGGALGPGQVRVGHGPEGLRAFLPAGWLASVWACGLSVVGGHLVIGVPEPGWPDARVLALPAPEREPVLLDVHGTTTGTDIPRWVIS